MRFNPNEAIREIEGNRYDGGIFEKDGAYYVQRYKKGWYKRIGDVKQFDSIEDAVAYASQ